MSLYLVHGTLTATMIEDQTAVDAGLVSTSLSLSLSRGLRLLDAEADGTHRRFFSEYFADNLAAMICECRGLAIGLALSVTGLACSRTPMNTIGTGEEPPPEGALTLSETRVKEARLASLAARLVQVGEQRAVG